MIATSQSIKIDLKNNDENIGKIIVSKFLKNISMYKIPFVNSGKKTLVKVGTGDYENFDSFIISSLNDYYNNLNNPTDIETKEEMLENYKRLYSLWSEICEAKENNEVVKIHNLYNKISYGLYLLGYDDKQL
jgi:hypothetical protein